MTPEPLVHAERAARTFGTGAVAVVAVHEVTCEIGPGDLIAITGPSGSGKTTLIHLLAGLDRPTAGTVTWPGIGGWEDLRPGPIAVVFQAPSLLPALDVRENVELPLLLAGVDPASARRRADEALTRLGLESLGSKLPEELSGGQAQRTAVARALVAMPRVILADEPTGQLDHASAVAVIDALLDVAMQTGAALVVNTHDAGMADRLPIHWAMHDGRLTVTEGALR